MHSPAAPRPSPPARQSEQRCCCTQRRHRFLPPNLERVSAPLVAQHVRFNVSTRAAGRERNVLSLASRLGHGCMKCMKQHCASSPDTSACTGGTSTALGWLVQTGTGGPAHVTYGPAPSQSQAAAFLLGTHQELVLLSSVWCSRRYSLPLPTMPDFVFNSLTSVQTIGSS